MAQAETFYIQLLIGNKLRTFPIRRDMEEYYRKAAEIINIRFNTYQQHFKGQSYEDYLSTVLLDFAMKIVMAESANDTEPFVKSMKQLTEEINELFESKKEKKK